jgi:hypothetical protein
MMSTERAIKNCVNCYEYANHMLSGSAEEKDIRGNPVLIQLYNNAMKAVEDSGIRNKKEVLNKCVLCNMSMPQIANELRKTKK